MNQIFANLARGLLAQNVDTTDTQFFVKNAVEVPSLDAGEFFIATVFTIGSDYGTNIEIVKVVQVDGNLWTVERGQEDTTAKEHPQNSRIELRLTAGALSDIYDELSKPKEWSAKTVTKEEAEAASGDERKAWTVTRVNEASQAWWDRSDMMDKLESIETDAKDDQLANEVPVVSTGNLESTNVQSALEELQLDIDTINDDLETKVDKVVGQGLSDSNYTQAEKDKLAGLESSHFKGQYTSLEALQEAFPLAAAGDYANVDEGVGFDVIRYVWDTSDSTWLPQLGASAQLSASQIKEEYESNPDTNVFSDIEKSKLDDIALEATKNRTDSENADKLHTHEFSDVTGLETVLADKASKTELNTELALKADKVEGKVFSDTNYTQDEKDKLAGLESSKFVGLFVSESALPTTGSIGDYANVDGGAGNDVFRVIWDSTNSKWVAMLGVSTALTDAQIKQQYESNPDTNGFTDDEKSKLNDIEVKATKNRADSANADKVHTHTTAQVTGLDAAFLTKFDKTSVVQSTGQSAEQVMSQKAVTDVIANIPPVPKTAAYTVVAADKGKSIDTTSNVTIRASVFTAGDVIVVTNTSATDSSIIAASGVTIRLAGTTKTGTLTLAGYGVATLRMVTSNNWFASGAGLK